MEKQLHKTMEAAQAERAIGKQDLSSGNENEKPHRHRGIFHLHHHSNHEKEEDEKKEGSKKQKDENKEGSKKEKIAAAMVGLGASALVKIMYPRNHGAGQEEGGGAEAEEGGGAEVEVEEEGEEDDGEGEGKFSAFISMIAEAFEG